MNQNDPGRLRIQAAKDYIGRLSRPDRVASVDFDSTAHLTLQNIGGAAHHLFSTYNNGIPDYSGAQTDLNSIDQSGSTNFGAALFVANNELISYGIRSHAWVIILLTDGQNTCCPNQAAGDAQARLEAARAKANNITVYTIGLGPGADGALLQEIATTTGGTYYAAPTADAIRFIYLEIANHYSGSVACGTITTASSISGSLTLDRGNRQYPVQTMSLEAGGVILTQPGGAVIHQGIPFEYTPRDLGTGSLRVTLITFVGAPFRASGSDYAVINAQFLYANTNEQPIIRPDLGAQARSVGNTSAYVQYWGGQGAATPGAVAAVRQPLKQAQARLNWSDANASAGKLSLAKFNVDSAQSQLSAAVTATNQQVTLGNMQAWLGKAVNDQIFFVACLLNQWDNWYNGITLTIQSPSAAAWALWFTDAFRTTGALTTYGVSGNTVVLTVNAVDRFTVEADRFPGGDRDGREGLVDLPDVDVVDLQVGTGQGLPDRRNRAVEHDRRVRARDTRGHETRARLQLQRPRLLRRGHEDSARAVIDSARVASGDATIGLERRRERGELLHGGRATRMLVRVEHLLVAALIEHGDRFDLLLEAAFVDRPDRLAVGPEGELVHLPPRDLVLVRDEVGGDALLNDPVFLEQLRPRRC